MSAIIRNKPTVIKKHHMKPLLQKNQIKTKNLKKNHLQVRKTKGETFTGFYQTVSISYICIKITYFSCVKRMKGKKAVVKTRIIKVACSV